MSCRGLTPRRDDDVERPGDRDGRAPSAVPAPCFQQLPLRAVVRLLLGMEGLLLPELLRPAPPACQNPCDGHLRAHDLSPPRAITPSRREIRSSIRREEWTFRGN